MARLGLLLMLALGLVALSGCGDEAEEPAKPAGNSGEKPGGASKPVVLPGAPRIENHPEQAHVGAGFTGFIRFEGFKVEFPFVQLGARIVPGSKTVQLRLVGQSEREERRDPRSFLVQWDVPLGELESLDGLAGRSFDFEKQVDERNAFFGRQEHYLAPVSVIVEAVTADAVTGKLEGRLKRKSGGSAVIIRGEFRAQRGVWHTK